MSSSGARLIKLEVPPSSFQPVYLVTLQMPKLHNKMRSEIPFLSTILQVGLQSGCIFMSLNLAHADNNGTASYLVMQRLHPGCKNVAFLQAGIHKPDLIFIKITINYLEKHCTSSAQAELDFLFSVILRGITERYYIHTLLFSNIGNVFF